MTQVGNDELTREMAAWAGQIAQLKQLLDEQSDGASDEWVASAHRALRFAEQRLRELRGPDDRAETVRDGTRHTT